MNLFEDFDTSSLTLHKPPANDSLQTFKELQELKSAAINVYHIVQNAKDPDDYIKKLRSLIFSEKK